MKYLVYVMFKHTWKRINGLRNMEIFFCIQKANIYAEL